jgi:hypothetical protein
MGALFVNDSTKSRTTRWLGALVAAIVIGGCSASAPTAQTNVPRITQAPGAPSSAALPASASSHPVPAATDAAAVVERARLSLAKLKSLQLDATMSVDATGDLLHLGTGTGKLEFHDVGLHGEVDLDRSAVKLHLTLPTLLGIELDFMAIRSEAWMRTSIGGDLWAPLHLGDTLSDKTWSAIVAALKETTATSVQFEVTGAETCGSEVCDRVSTDRIESDQQGRPRSKYTLSLLVRRSDGMLLGLHMDGTQTDKRQPELAMTIDASISQVNEPVSIVKPTARQMTDVDPFRGFPGIGSPSS